MPKNKKPVIQEHHIVYEDEEKGIPEQTVLIYKGEHWILTQMQRRKKISQGFIIALQTYINDNQVNATDLRKEM